MRALTITTGEGTLRANLDRPLDLSIPLRFGAAQPAAFGAPAARSTVFRSGDFVGDVTLGGSCNCAEYRFIPHCNGTHTECVGHLTRQRISIQEVLSGGLEPALLLSVSVIAAQSSIEDSDPRPQPQDALITAQAIEAAWSRHEWPGRTVRAIALRTLPNDPSKQTRRYDEAPYLTRQAVELLVQRGVEHLLVDVPSLDRLSDGGRLTGHRLFWGLPAGSTDLHQAERPQATVTELMFAADAIEDGRYVLDLQIAAFAADAAPSRPILYPVID